ncbi:hypothetical protein NDU88_004598 [Pleurodeles waltl]|uniref:Uncharacterized protein n=1 Tax=Pleurodeles waltl TaxID=8319 RepID=A0AAV7WVZ2_PLEWA|nr:hypothetical protein NDU88_004598 [Pleurodeles waltl]
MFVSFVSFVSEEVGEERGAVGKCGGKRGAQGPQAAPGPGWAASVPLQRPDRSLSPSPLRALASRVVRFNRPDSSGSSRQAGRGERSALCRTACLAR